MRNVFIIACVIVFYALTGLHSAVLGNELVTKIVIAKKDSLLSKYEKNDRLFKRLENTKLKIVTYFHRRRIGEVIVEKDFIRYQFNTETGELIDKKKHWREGLPEHISPVITQQQAESMVTGKVETSRLYLISPKSQVFRIKPTPTNACWIVWTKEERIATITIIDAMTGENLGQGVPPPFDGFAFHCDAEDGWKDWRDNADEWFEEKMGYTIRRNTCACDTAVQSRIQSDDIAIFYEISHGDSSIFHWNCTNGCSNLTAAEVETWIDTYANMPFTFLASCYGMCNQTDDHLSYEFRKGADDDAVTVGYCGMSDNPCAADCWPDALDWQDEFFSLMADGWPVGAAFDRANQAFPDCSGANNCMRIAGDRLLVFAGSGVPKVARSISGAVYNKAPLYQTPLPGVPARVGYRAYYVRGDINVPASRFLTVAPSASKPYVDLLFMNDSSLAVYGQFLYANGANGEIRLVSVDDISKGIKIIGTVRMLSGGKIKIYE